MVADSNSEKNLEEPDCGDAIKHQLISAPKHDSSHESFSSESTKSTKSKIDDDELHETDSPLSEMGDHNRTYSCPKKTMSGYIDDLDTEKADEAAQSEVTKSREDNWLYESKTLKCRNLFSLSSHLHHDSHWNTETSDVKIGNLTAEYSKLVTENADECTLLKFRNYLADYQESRGTSRDEYTFSHLIRVIGQATGRCLLALFYVIINIAPVLEVFLHILRFIFDKVIDIRSTADLQQIVVKSVIFFLQLVGIYVCLLFIFGFFVGPVIRMTFGILTKILLYD